MPAETEVTMGQFYDDFASRSETARWIIDHTRKIYCSASSATCLEHRLDYSAIETITLATGDARECGFITDAQVEEIGALQKQLMAEYRLK